MAPVAFVKIPQGIINAFVLKAPKHFFEVARHVGQIIDCVTQLFGRAFGLY